MKGLSFSEPMVKAWLDGRKTVTRRLMNPQPDEHYAGGVPFVKGDIDKVIKPRYFPGETVYIKETWCQLKSGIVIYKATEPVTEYSHLVIWKSPRYMPEWAARSHARIASVRPERVQEITEDEAIKEGIIRVNTDLGILFYYDVPSQWSKDYRDVFSDLWESLHPGSWEHNDWVWRIELEQRLYKERLRYHGIDKKASSVWREDGVYRFKCLETGRQGRFI